MAGGDNRDGAALKVRFEQRQGLDGLDHLALAEASVEPLWTENNWGASADRREIRVIRVAAAEARVRAELDRLSDAVEGPENPP